MAKEKNSSKMKNVLSGLLFEVMTNIPESLLEPVENPDERVEKLIQAASLKAAAVSTTLSIPAGVTGIVAAVPDVVAVWKIQSQLVSDIAAVHGKIALLSRESMMICLFKHSMSHIIKDVFIRTGTRFVVHKLTTEAFRAAVKRISLQISSKFLRRMFAKIIPAVGAISNGAISYWDTKQVGKTAQAYFQSQTTPRP